jgi:mannose-6-phosphate isomerase-like protein (cupin superfamily)
MKREPIVRYLDSTEAVDCPYGEAKRLITGGQGGVANVHHITVTEGGGHFHQGYDEVYYVLKGSGALIIDGQEHPLRPGAAAVIPRGCVHSLKADQGEPLEFIIIGSPAMGVDDERFWPRKPPE